MEPQTASSPVGSETLLPSMESEHQVAPMESSLAPTESDKLLPSMDSETSLAPMETEKEWTWKKRIETLFLSDELTDVTFVVEGEKIEAHILVVAIRSPILKKIIHETSDDEVIEVIQNVNVDDFKTFLKYLYTDECSFTRQNIPALLTCGDQYEVPSLIQACKKFVESQLGTAHGLYYVRMITRNPLLYSFIKKVSEVYPDNLNKMNFVSVKKDGSVVVAPVDFVHRVVRDFDRSVENEDELFGKIYEWAKAECIQRKTDDDAFHIRQVLADIIPYIRFSNLKPKTLAEIVRSNRLISDDQIYECLCIKASNNDGFQ